MSSTELDVDINVFTRPEGISDPFKYYDLFRPLSPVPGYVDWSPGTVPGIDPPYTAWALFTHDQVLHVLRHPEIFSNRDPAQEESAAPSLMLEGHDDPEHARLRKLVSQAFTPRRIAGLGPFLDEQVTEALDQLGEGTFDACETLTPVLPTRSMAKLLGLPGVSFDKLQDWANAFMQSAPLSPEERQARCMEMIQVVTQTVMARKEALDQQQGALALEDVDLVTALLLANEAGRTEVAPTEIDRGAHAGRSGLTPEDIVLFVTTLLVAGNETTISLSGHCLNVLAREPEVQAALRADRSLMNNFIDETMRMYGSGQRLFKWVLADTEIDGHRIAKDEWVAIFLIAANRDPAVFPDPHTFDLHRPNVRQHLSFGHGIHYCLGAALGRLNVSTLVNAVLDRYSTIEATDEPPTVGTVSIFTHALWRLPIELRH
jgi:cytochrome P450